MKQKDKFPELQSKHRWISEMLTLSEIEQLRQKKKDDNGYFQKAFKYPREK